MAVGSGKGTPVTTGPAAATAAGAGNEYVTYEEIKDYLKITTTGDDDLLVVIATRASRIWDTLTRRCFYEKKETRHFDYQDSYELFLNADLLSLITLTNGDGDAIAAADYFLYPANFYPKLWIEVGKGSGEAFVYETTRQQAISIEGLWGWHDDYGNAWAGSGDTVQDSPLTAGATTLNVSSGGNFKVQQTIKIEDEQLYVESISGNALTVARGRNGTTAAEHIKAKAITIWAPAADVVNWVLIIAQWLYRRKDTSTFGKVAFPQMGTVEIPMGLPSEVREAATFYHRRRV